MDEKKKAVDSHSLDVALVKNVMLFPGMMDKVIKPSNKLDRLARTSLPHHRTRPMILCPWDFLFTPPIKQPTSTTKNKK